MTLEDTLRAFLVSAKNAGCRKLIVAYSGGIDSHVLLSGLNQFNQGDAPLPLEAIYINHQLHAASSQWGKHCQQVCHNLGIVFQQIDVQAAPEPGESPEEKARAVRYQALAGGLQPDQWLLTAQHMDDQAETLLLQLLRGSGVDGLSGMPQQRSLGQGQHYRPMLKLTKQQIQDYASEQQLHWIEDPSNQDQGIARNYIRKTVLPVFKQNWPETTFMLDRSAGWLSEAAAMIAEIAEQDLGNCLGKYQSIKINELKKLSYIRQKNLLRYWFHSLKLKRPGIDKLQLIFEQIIDAREDANPRLDWQGICLRRYRERLYMLPEYPEPDTEWQVNWDGHTAISLVDDWATLSMVEVIGHGLSREFLQQPLTLQLRKGGEQCHPVGRSQNRSLKKLFQEFSVPTWLRDRWPLLYCNEQLIAVPGLFVCKGFEAKGSEAGLDFFVEDKQSIQAN